MGIYKTEITSDIIPSDNPLHQRLLKPYVMVSEWVRGDLLELGCGEGRGVPYLSPVAGRYVGFDKIKEVIDRLKKRYPDQIFEQVVFPPVSNLSDNSFDTIVSFQVIEHIQDDSLFLKEVYRILRPGGKAYITTPNIRKTLSRNPWHIREYQAGELISLTEGIFDKVQMKGIAGNEKVMAYYENNRKSVEEIMRFDFLDLQHKLPAFMLKFPYEVMNRLNRNKLKSSADELVMSIKHDDYLITDEPEEALDLFGILYKK